MKKLKTTVKVNKGKCKYCPDTVQNLDAHIKEKHLNELVKEGKRSRKSEHVRR
ncbi:MAG: hypothetical protein Q8R00_04345 [Candidatus Nanoarchaeia archaeon]|nr:hypothetical protein [Candidatus Nanoarchaeia archaeon]